jgi:filamentous hemagglutinin family protein
MLKKKQCLRYIFLASILGSVNGAYAQSITPANDGLNTNVNQVGNQYNITGGTQAGANLFYSLQKLGLSTGEVANFLSNPSVQNVLTRVTGGQASLINGLIQMTGGNSNLFILNPAGIVFGANASLHVPANFSATTATGIQVGNGWFGINSSVDEVRNLTGNITGYGFTNTLPSLDTAQSGVISNEGKLQTDIGKSVTLVGGMVVNTGTIATPEGNITIAATPDNKFIKITNEGSLMSLELPIADQQVIGNAPLLRGVDLPSLLIGKTSGTTIISGNLDVSGSNGGNIQVLGNNVGLVNANINASGVNGGGTVLIGGDLQGTGTTLTAQSTMVDANSKINADALTNGNGGKVIVWADDTTKFDGTITAKSGIQSGNGGLVETSGKNTLIVGNTAQVNTSSPQGLSGNWLLDPTSITVVAAGGIDPTVAAANANAGASTINSAVIETALGVGNVTLTATNTITVDAAINSASGNGLVLNAPTTNLNAPITLTGTLTGNATTVNVGAAGTVKNGVDAAASGATVSLATTYTLGETVLINKNLTVNGAGANNTIVSGNNAVRVFEIDNNSTVNINDLTVARGSSNSDSGGAKTNTGTTLNLNRTIFSENYGGLGSAIFNGSGAILNVDNTIISNNSANAGSGVVNFGTATVSNSTFSNNSANIIGAFYNSDGVSTISNSTFSGNTLANRAGAAVLNQIGTTNISNSTFSGNSTGTNGRGIIFNFSGTTNISNSTVFGNTPNPQGAIFTESGTTNIANSIILGNSTVGNPEIFVTDRTTNPVGVGTINFTGTNIVGADGTSGISISGNGTVTGVTPITPAGAASTVINTTLANNGGLTQTFALVPDSIAIDSSSTTGGAIPTTSDQRGILTVNGTRDIGAFESRGFTLTPINGTTPQSTTVNTLFGNLLGVAVSFDSIGSVDGRTVTFTAPSTLASGLFDASNITTATVTGGIATAGAAFRANSTSGTYNVTATVTGSTNSANFTLTNTPVALPPVVVPPVVVPPKPIIDPNKETRRHDEKKVLTLSSLTPIAFLSTDDIEFQRLNRFLIAIIELMNQDGGDLVINAHDIWQDVDISIINKSSNQEVIKLAIRNSIGKFIGDEYINLVDITFETKKEQKNILLKVRKSPKPAKFLKN